MSGFPAGIRALLLDLDGVLVMRGQLLPDAGESLARLDAAGFPYLVATNMTLVSRRTLAAQMAAGGLNVPADRIMTAASAAAAYCARAFAGKPVYVMGTPDAVSEFEGQRVLGYDEAAAADSVAAVVVGDAADEFTTRNMQSAFRLLRRGARFIAMHRNRWWTTPAGPTLDSGAYVAALEFGTQRRALVTGKPSGPFFREGVRRLADVAAATDTGRLDPPLAAADVAMVGDDLWNDVLGAQKAGLRGIFVRSGKHGDRELARLASERHGRRPEATLPSIAEVVDGLLG
jgi:HAD superfamily hydrolase (TIGR01458 family)